MASCKPIVRRAPAAAAREHRAAAGAAAVPLTSCDAALARQMRERFGRLAALSAVTGPEQVRPADEVEQQLLGELRALGAVLMSRWAQGAEAQVAAEVRRRRPQSELKGKKNSAG